MERRARAAETALADTAASASDSTRPLLRQIEAMQAQAQARRRAEAEAEARAAARAQALQEAAAAAAAAEQVRF